MPVLLNPLNRDTLKRLAGTNSFQKGEDYFKRHRVKKLRFINGEKIEAEVKGSKHYLTNIYLKEQQIASYSCTCPVNGFCKHLVASSLYAIEKMNMLQEEATKSTQVNKPDLNSEISLVLLGLIALRTEAIKIDELIVMYKNITKDPRSNIELSNEIYENLEFYTELKIISKNPWRIDTYKAYPFIKTALESKYTKDIINEVRMHVDKSNNASLSWQNAFNHCYARMCFAYFTNDEKLFKKAVDKYNKYKGLLNNSLSPYNLYFLIDDMRDSGFDITRLNSLAPVLKQEAEKLVFEAYAKEKYHFKVTDYVLNNAKLKKDQDQYNKFFLEALIIAAELDKAKSLLDNYASINQKEYFMRFTEGTLAFLHGDTKLALKKYEQGLKEERAFSRKSANTIYGPDAVFYILAMMQFDLENNSKKIERCINENFQTREKIFELIEAFYEFQNDLNEKNYNDFLDSIDTDDLAHPDNYFLNPLLSLFQYFIDSSDLKLNTINQMLAKAPSLGLTEKIYIDLLKAFAIKPAKDRDYGSCIDFTKLFKTQELWKRKIDQLKNYFSVDDRDSGTQTRKQHKYSFVWILDTAKKLIEFKKRTLLKSGKWSSGKTYDLSNLYRVSDSENLLTPQEKKILDYSEQEFSPYNWHYRNNSNKTNEYDPVDKVLIDLCSLDNIYSDQNASHNIKLKLAKPCLEALETKNDTYKIKLSHDFTKPQVFLERVDEQNYNVVQCGADLLNLKGLLGDKGIEVPIQAKDDIKKILKAAAADLEIHSDLETEDLPSFPASTKPYILVYFDSELFTLKLDLFMNPASDGSNLIKAGTGRELLKIEKNDSKQKFICIRDFLREIKVMEKLKIMLGIETETVEFSGIEECFEMLSKLENLAKTHPDSFDIEWKQGKKIKIIQKQSFSSLSINVKSANDWFEYSGELRADDDKVINISEILANLENGIGNYVKLQSGEFLGLTEELKKSLQKLRYISSGENKIHKLASNSLQDLETLGADLNKDEAWQEFLNKIKNFNKLKVKVPTGLKTQLRDYQYEGFVWLSRLAYLGAGACLADDMGLGKTIQTIAVLMNHLKTKPCLVVAPTSVINNWQSELEKFAPSVKTFMLSDYAAQGEDRKTIVDNLKKNNLLLCSYGLLQNNEELFEDKEFGMVVLDESQAIKNPLTKRASAAKKLKANSRLVLSGTPIENNLTELWSQFDFINPGLLGSLKDFQGRYANAIEVNKDKTAQAALRQLIQPYILRRTKTEVLSDLPAKIEQTVSVSFDPDEAAFYEALRKKAVEKLEDSQENNMGKRKLEILAEMSKLRRACCHPSLVNAPGNYEGSKNKEFLELVSELKANNHKALVFSQYTSYLKLLRSSLDLLEVNYLYLDGSTPIGKRKKLVKEFQEGNADLFLLSLKAGGSGLNLTEADYVIHLDPWWNPAVEDQATDRAHRIGQNKTVNVYRLIMKGSIEEKILKLHETKRELADELLAEADMTAKLSDKELIAMMKG